MLQRGLAQGRGLALEQGLAYRCNCSQERLDALRTERLKRKEKPRYDGRCRERDPAEVQAEIEAAQAKWEALAPRASSILTIGAPPAARALLAGASRSSGKG